MALTKEDIERRLKEIPQQIAALSAEQNQLLGYKQALLDCCENGECCGSKEEEEKASKEKK
tara:strand:- start:212 stop:394 length:183 start_codon:yes stop_codon:yes gene_type:complete